MTRIDFAEGADQNVKQALVASLIKNCSLCNALATFHGVYLPNEDERRRWGGNWCAYGLCDQCVGLPDVRTRLHTYFVFELDPAGSQVSS